jgi:hypothetical protein
LYQEKWEKTDTRGLRDGQEEARWGGCCANATAVKSKSNAVSFIETFLSFDLGPDGPTSFCSKVSSVSRGRYEFSGFGEMMHYGYRYALALSETG